jgi:hypothetical protein
MKKFKQNLFIAAAFTVLGITGLFMNAREAVAQNPNAGSAPVTIVGPLPVPVTLTVEGTEPVVVRKIDEPGRIPYQVTVRGDGPVLPAVPAGHRLVIETVSMRSFLAGTGLGMMKVTINPGNTQFTFPMTFAGTEAGAGNLWVGHASATIYVNPGMTVQFGHEAPFQVPAVQATVSGYLLECSTALPCDPIAP